MTRLNAEAPSFYCNKSKNGRTTAVFLPSLYVWQPSLGFDNHCRTFATTFTFTIAPTPPGLLHAPLQYSPLSRVREALRNGEKNKQDEVSSGERRRQSHFCRRAAAAKPSDYEFHDAETRFWAPRYRNQSAKMVLGPRSLCKFEFRDEREDTSMEEDARTTVMIRNLPSNLTRNKLMEILDEHCSLENQKIAGVVGASGARSEFDFLYVPVDFDTEKNLGYAFVNFTSSTAALTFHRAFHLQGWGTGSSKVKEIRYARIQGLEELTRRFKKTTFLFEDGVNGEDFLPAFFVPSRDGERETSCKFVGRLVRKKTSLRDCC